MVKTVRNYTTVGMLTSYLLQLRRKSKTVPCYELCNHQSLLLNLHSQKHFANRFKKAAEAKSYLTVKSYYSNLNVFTGVPV